MRRILCISFSPLSSDARVLRQIRVLSEFGEVTTVGYGRQPSGAVHHLQLPSNAKSLPETVVGVMKLALRMYRSVELTSPGEVAASTLLRDAGQFDLVVANDARALPLAFSVAARAPVVADLHEWAIQENTSSLLWRLLVGPYMDALCKRYLGQVSAATTVNKSIADLYADRYGVRPGVVRNAIPYQNLVPSLVEGERVRLVHSGVAVPERNIESLIEAADSLGDRFSLDLYLMGDDDGYLGQLKRKARNVARVSIQAPVSPSDLPGTLNAYDLGIYLLPVKSLNHQLMLPNKFFDFVQARLGVLISPATETSALIAQYDLGPRLANHSVSGLVSALESLSADDVRRYKQNAHHAAEALSSASDEDTIRTVLSELLRG
jgi:glycosyltransferase involved in cell wall biosynthesis